MYLSIDVGTHAARAAIVSTQGAVRHMQTEPLILTRRDARCVEQDPAHILAATRAVIQRVLLASPVKPVAAAIACQRSTVVAWHRNSLAPLGPALSWQDTRGVDQVEALQAHAEQIKQISGLVLSAHYGASKLRWLQQHYKLTAEQHCAGPLISFLLAQLLELDHHTVDESNAGRTQLWDLRGRCWSDELLALFQVDPGLLPDVAPTCHDYGQLRDSGIPLVAVAGDQNAALAAILGVEQQQTLLANLGSGAFMLRYAKAGQAVPTGLLHGLAFSDAGTVTWLCEGTVNGAGLALTELAQRPPFSGQGGEAAMFAQLPEWLMHTQPEWIYLNTVGGLGSPLWRVGPSPRFEAVTTAVQGVPDAAQQAVAAVESIVFLLAANAVLLQQAGKVECILVTGGLAALGGLCQRLANLTGLLVKRLEEREATLLGAARLASAFTLPLQQAKNGIFEPQTDTGLSARYDLFQQRIQQQ